MALPTIAEAAALRDMLNGVIERPSQRLAPHMRQQGWLGVERRTLHGSDDWRRQRYVVTEAGIAALQRFLMTLQHHGFGVDADTERATLTRLQLTLDALFPPHGEAIVLDTATVAKIPGRTHR